VNNRLVTATSMSSKINILCIEDEMAVADNVLSTIQKQITISSNINNAQEINADRQIISTVLRN